MDGWMDGWPLGLTDFDVDGCGRLVLWSKTVSCALLKATAPRTGYF